MRLELKRARLLLLHNIRYGGGSTDRDLECLHWMEFAERCLFVCSISVAVGWPFRLLLGGDWVAGVLQFGGCAWRL